MSTRVSKVVLFSRKKRPANKTAHQTETEQEKAQQGVPRQSRAQLAAAQQTKARQAAALDKPQQKRRRRKKTLRRRFTVLGIVLAILAGLYCTAVFSSIPFIKNLRDLYIQTAMDTYTHKWLATMFIPTSVIEKVMAEKQAFIDGQEGLESSWAPTPSGEPTPSAEPSAAAPSDNAQAQARIDFLNEFYELDAASFDDYIEQNPSLLENGYNRLLINEAGIDDKGTTIYTTAGDQVLAVDAENGIIIIKVTGPVEGGKYNGKMAIIRNPSQVRVGISKYLGDIGQTVRTIAKNNNAVLAINASGFADPEWNGNGGSVVGLLIANGKMYNKSLGNGYKNIGFGEDDRLYIGASTSQMPYRDAVEFMPAIIVNGKDVTGSASGFFGLQPRSVIGQADDGTVFLLIIDGRQPGHSIGAKVTQCAEIMLRYHAVQAANLDGGSSSIMIYRDEILTKTSGVNDFGRLCPDAFIVDYADKG